MLRPLPIIFTALCSLAIFTAHAATSANNYTPAANSRQLRDQLQSLVTQLAVSGAFGENARSLNLSLNTPAHRVTDLGVLIDTARAANAHDGLRVLGTSPGSTAARAGLRPGDILVAVNGTSLRHLGKDDRGQPLAVATLKSAVAGLPDAAALHLQVKRNGALINVDAQVHSIYVPAIKIMLGSAAIAATDARSNSESSAADNGCGRISTFDVAPRGKRQYHARILLLDGVSPNSRQQTFRVKPGKHVLLVSEDIPTLQMGVGEIATGRRHTRKILHVDVKPDTTLMIGAQLHLDKVTQLNNGKYWDPVVWRVVERACP